MLNKKVMLLANKIRSNGTNDIGVPATIQMWKSLILPHFLYSVEAFTFTNKTMLSKLERLYYSTLKVCLKLPTNTPTQDLIFAA